MTPPSSPDADPPLLLVGTVHRHPGGQADLIGILERVRPDTITLEMSRYAVQWRLSTGPRLQGRLERILDLLAAAEGYPRDELDSHPEIVAIRSLLAFPDEFRAATAWGGPRGVPVEPIDLSGISARKLRRVEEDLVTPQNIRILLSLPREGPKGEGLAAARRFIEGKTDPEVRRAFLARRRGAEGIGIRDRWLERAIRRRMRNGAGKRLLHIGGWVHLVEDPQGETLYSRLRDVRPRRILAGSGSVSAKR